MEYMISGGKRRLKTESGKCKHCGNEFFHFKWDEQSFCSQKCFFVYTKSMRPFVKCVECGKQIQTFASLKKRNNNNYCSRECYDRRRKDCLKQLKRHTLFYDTLLNNSKCECGVTETFLLQIHHIDGDKTNNSKENLEVVCANCHIRRHLKARKKDNALVYHTKTLTTTEILNKLKLGNVISPIKNSLN